MNEELGPQCEVVKKLLPDFLKERLSDSEKKSVENHLKECDECFSIFEGIKADSMMELKDEHLEIKQRKLENIFFKRVLGRIVIACALVIAICYIVLTFIFQTIMAKPLMKKNEMVRGALNDIVHFNIPGGRAKGGWLGRLGPLESINIFEFEQPLLFGNSRSGKFDLAVPNYIGEIDWKTTYLDNGAVFPVGWGHQVNRNDDSLKKVKSKLEAVKDWSLSSLTVYFEKPVTLENLDVLVTKIDNGGYREWWFSIDTSGISINKWGYKNMGFLRANWGFPLNIEMVGHLAPDVTDFPKNEAASNDGVEDGSNIDDLWALDAKQPVAQSFKYFKNEMKRFIEYSKYLKDDEFASDLIKVNDLIGSKNLRFNGVLLKVPTVSALKLFDDKNIADVRIVEVEFNYDR
ncbi:MAG TPA: zf-HC2 domain-containing protein [Pseudobacteroides sp.]|uniref:zf-HC2 domain-containing protein n=1 Tax=Pseudobacteroides sp. TaxID=1968840 RepID=UPI002F957D0A